jgi:DNA-binding transcriptional MerR regulator
MVLSRPMPDSGEAGPPEFTVDQLARWAQLPVRTIREYQTMRLLPPPRRRGRVGLYGQTHAQRLALINRLQRRGYSLAAIKDLLEARDDGTDLATLLGVDVGPEALDETPRRLTKTQLHARLPGLTAAVLRQARSIGLLAPDGEQHFLVRSPALLALVTDGINAGVGIAEMLEVVGGLRDRVGVLADSVADRVIEHVVEPLNVQGRVAELAPMLRWGRLLLLQGALSTLADRLGEALADQADPDTDGGRALRAAIDEIRAGAIAGADGNLKYWSRT